MLFHDFFNATSHDLVFKTFQMKTVLSNFDITDAPVHVSGWCEEYIRPDIDYVPSMTSVSEMCDNVCYGITFDHNGKPVALFQTPLDMNIASMNANLKNAISMIVNFGNNRRHIKRLGGRFQFASHNLRNLGCLADVAIKASYGAIPDGKKPVMHMMQNIHKRDYGAILAIPDIITLTPNQINKMKAYRHREKNHKRLERLVDSDNLMPYRPDDLPLSHFSSVTMDYTKELISKPANRIDTIHDVIPMKYRKKDMEIIINGDIYHYGDMDKRIENRFLYCDASVNDDTKVMTCAFCICDEMGTISVSGEFSINGSLFHSSNFAELFCLKWCVNNYGDQVKKYICDSVFAISMVNKKEFDDCQFMWVKGHKHNALNSYVDTMAGIKSEEINEIGEIMSDTFSI